MPVTLETCPGLALLLLPENIQNVSTVTSPVLAGAAIGYWRDASANAAHASQGTAGSRPVASISNLCKRSGRQRAIGVKSDTTTKFLSLGTPASLSNLITTTSSYSFVFLIRCPIITGGPTYRFVFSKSSGDGRVGFGLINTTAWARNSGFTHNQSATYSMQSNYLYAITYTFASSGTNTGTERFYFNGALVATRTGAMPAPDNSASWIVNAFGSGTFATDGDTHLIAAYDHELTTQERADIDADIASRYTPIRVICIGDSLTRGANSTDGGDYPCQLAETLGVHAINFGVSGRKIADMLTDTALYIAAAKARTNVFVIMAGINDLSQTHSLPDMLTNLQSLVAAVRPYGKVAVCTVLERSGAPGADQLSFNTSIRAGLGSWYDILIDGAGDSILGAAGVSANTNYFHTDQLHMVNNGYGRLATIAATAISPHIFPTASDVLYAEPVGDGTTGSLPLARVMQASGGNLLPASVRNDTSDGLAAGGTYDAPAALVTAAASQLATDTAAVNAGKADINNTRTILGVTGTQNLPAIQSAASASGAATQLTTDQAAVAAQAQYIREGITILGQAGQDELAALTPEAVADATWIKFSGRAPVNVPTLQKQRRVIYQGDTYGAGYRLFAASAADGGEWPLDLSDGWAWTITLTKAANNLTDGTESVTGTATVTTPTGATRGLRIGLTATQTSGLVGDYLYDIEGSKDGNVWTVESGTVSVTPQVTVNA